MAQTILNLEIERLYKPNYLVHQGKSGFISLKIQTVDVPFRFVSK